MFLSSFEKEKELRKNSASLDRYAYVLLFEIIFCTKNHSTVSQKKMKRKNKIMQMR